MIFRVKYGNGRFDQIAFNVSSFSFVWSLFTEDFVFLKCLKVENLKNCTEQINQEGLKIIFDWFTNQIN